MEKRKYDELERGKQEKLIAEFRNREEEIKKDYQGFFKLRGGDDIYNVVSNILINDLNNIEHKDSFVSVYKNHSLNINEYYSELIAKTPIGVALVDTYIEESLLLNDR